MFLLVFVRHVGAHPGEHHHGVFIQICISLGKTFLQIHRIRNTPLTWILASRGGSRGRVQGVRTLPWEDLRFSNTTGILQKKKKPRGLLVLKKSKRRVHPLLKKILDPPLARVFVYIPPFISQILDFIYWTVLIIILFYFEWRDTENQQYCFDRKRGWRHPPVIYR